MKFMEIKEGLSVKLSGIESIQRNEEDGGSIVIMKSGSVYKTSFQFIQLLQMVEIELNINEEPKQETPLARQFFNG